MTKYYLLFPIILLLLACKNEPKESKLNPPKPTNIPELTAKLICQPSNEATETMPNSEVFLSLGDYKLKIGYLLNCSEIDTADFANYQIPKEALTAAGGWWAGEGDYFYVVKDEDNFVVKKGYMDEQQEADNYHYQTISTFSKTGQPIYSKRELTGIYTLGGHDESYIFILGIDANRNWDAVMYRNDGMLPPPDETERYLADFKMTELKKFMVNMNDLSFDSDMGQGQIEISPDFKTITFFDKKWPLDGVFEMEKIK